MNNPDAKQITIEDLFQRLLIRLQTLQGSIQGTDIKVDLPSYVRDIVDLAFEVNRYYGMKKYHHEKLLIERDQLAERVRQLEAELAEARDYIGALEDSVNVHDLPKRPYK